METTDRPVFTPVDVNEVQQTNIDIIQEAFGVILGNVTNHVPVGREQAIVITKLEEACMWAVKGICHPQ